MRKIKLLVSLDCDELKVNKRTTKIRTHFTF